jgi:hypothetical protein
MPRVGFEHTILVFDRAKTVHVLDRSATVIGCEQVWFTEIKIICWGQCETQIERTSQFYYLKK